MYKRDVSCWTDHGDTRLYMPQKHEIYEIFLQFFERYCGKFYKKCSTRNEEWIKFESATITSDYVLHNHLSI